MDVKSVKYCENLVGEIEALDPAAWARFRGHRKYEAFADEYLTAKCVVDFWWFLQFGVYHRAMGHYDNGLHRDVAHWLMDWTREVHGAREPVRVKWLIMARELCKTQILIARDVWKFVRNRNERLLIRAYIDEKAQEISTGIMGMILAPDFQRRFGWVRPATQGMSNQAIRWRADKFILDREEVAVRVPSMEACGVEGEPTGGHFQMSHYDDYEVKTNADSETLRKKMFDTWRNDNNLHMAGSERSCAGTPWSRSALVHGILYRCNGMEAHDYDVYRTPCWTDVMEEPLRGHEPQLAGDRVTVVDRGAGFPTIEMDLQCMQARLRFFSDSAKDVVEEVREIVWNDGSSFRMNRPIPEMLRQPLDYVIGMKRPSCPLRQTMDSVDYKEGSEVELPAVINTHLERPGIDRILSRNSLPAKRQEEGPTVFAAQNELNAQDEESLILNPDDYIVVSPETFAGLEGMRRYYRSADFATAKSTRAATSMTTGCWHDTGLYLTHIAYHKQMSGNAKILELLLGSLRVTDRGSKLLKTSFETTSAIEDTLGEFWREAQEDPYRYFSNLKAKRPGSGMKTYKDYAEEFFKDVGRMRIVEHWIPRKASKIERISASASACEQGRVHIVSNCPHIDVLYEEARSCTHASKGGFDLLDNVADLITEFAPPRRRDRKKESAPVDMFGRFNQKALEAVALMDAGVNPGWGRN